MNTKLKIGVIGAGWFASRRHLPDILKSPDAELAAICRRDETALADMAREFSPRSTFTDWEHMLQDCPMDAVLIATPNNQHYAQARAALERGVHVLVEKPMTIESQEAWHLVEVAKERNLNLSTALNPPFWAHCQKMRQAVISGQLGVVEAVSYFWTGNAEQLFGDRPISAPLPGVVPPTLYRQDPVQNGGGYFVDGGPHLLSQLLYVTGLRPRRVNCFLDKLPSDRRAVLSIELENGAFASVVSLGDSQSGNRRVNNVVGCSKGTIITRGFEFETTILPIDGAPETFMESTLEPVAGPVQNLLNAILGRSELAMPASHGAEIVSLMEAAYASAATGQTVTLSIPR